MITCRTLGFGQSRISLVTQNLFMSLKLTGLSHDPGVPPIHPHTMAISLGSSSVTLHSNLDITSRGTARIFENVF